MKRLPVTRLARVLLIATVACATFVACGRFHLGGEDEPTLLIFTNEALDQADVFAVAQSGETVRIGTVFSGRTDTLTVPSSMIASGQYVNVVARMFARNTRPQSGPIAFRAGEVYTARLSADEKLIGILPAP